MTSIIPKEFSYLEHDEYSEFDEKIYKTIKCTQLHKFQKYLSNIYSHYKLNYVCSLINNFQFKFETNKLELICTVKYEKDKLGTFLFQDNGFFIDFIDYSDLLDNLEKFTARYYPILTILSIPGFNEHHCAVFIMDKTEKIVYLVDSNGDIINYYAKYFDEPEIINMYFHNCMSQLFGYINYKYIAAFFNNITKTINKQNDEINAKVFFSGYCVAWSIFFSELFLCEKNQYHDIKKIMNEIYKLTNLQRNEIINRYHSYLYLNYCVQCLPHIK